MKKIYYLYKQFGIKYRHKIIIAFFLILFVGFINMSHQVFIGRIVDFLSESKWEMAFGSLSIYTVLFSLGQLMHTGINAIWIYLRTNFLGDIRTSLFSKIVNAQQQQIDQERTSELLKCINYDAEEVLSLIYHNLFYGIANTIKLIIGIGVIFYIKLEFGILSCFAIPFVTALDLKIKTQIRNNQANYHSMDGHLISQIREFSTGFQEIIQLDAQPFFSKKILEATISEKQAQRAVDRNVSTHDILVNCVLQLTYYTVYLYGALCIFENSTSIGQVITVISYINTCKSLFRGLTQRRSAIQKNMAAVDRIIYVHKLPQEESGYEHANSISNIHFQNVGFSYNCTTSIASNISTTISSGQAIHITGKNGDGKTTLLKLITGIYPPSVGSIKINGKSIVEYSLYSLRRKIGVVWQAPYIIPDTIRGNILLGNTNISDQEIWNVLHHLGIKQEIERLPLGLDTEITSKNIPLSSGQIKRLCLSRILLSDPDVLILDEMSAPLDQETADKIYTYISKLYDNRIIIYIAHDRKCSFHNEIELCVFS